MSLAGKAAIVTGATSGIGLGIARALAEAGANVVLNGFADAETVKKVRCGISGEFGVQVEFSDANVGVAEDNRRLIATAIDAFGRVDILVNNAGIQFTAPLEEFPDDRWEAIVAINLSSNFHTIKAALPRMRQQNWGRIVNVASTHGLVASTGKAAYVAAKHGVIGLTKVVALETARTGITCNAICPGWVFTPLVERQIKERAKQGKISIDCARAELLAEKQPSQEFATPEQIGALAVFLCSQAASQIRGAALTVDGGWTAQ